MPTSEKGTDLLASVTALAQAGDPQAQLALGQMLLNAVGTPRDEKGALHWFLTAAAQDVPMACNMVGRCCELGWAVPRNPADAMMWYLRAANGGLDWGMYNYANGLALGWHGGLRDLDGALLWYRRAAGIGHCKSLNIIGGFYEDGWSVARDLRRARAYYARAARCGDFRGHFNLGRFLMNEGRRDEAERHFARARETATEAFTLKMDEFLKDR